MAASSMKSPGRDRADSEFPASGAGNSLSALSVPGFRCHNAPRGFPAHVAPSYPPLTTAPPVATLHSDSRVYLPSVLVSLAWPDRRVSRSEEHTSELQSPMY